MVDFSFKVMDAFNGSRDFLVRQDFTVTQNWNKFIQLHDRKPYCLDDPFAQYHSYLLPIRLSSLFLRSFGRPFNHCLELVDLLNLKNISFDQFLEQKTLLL